MTSAPGTWTLEQGIRSRASYHLACGDVWVSGKIFNSWYSASSKQYDIQVEELESGGGGGGSSSKHPLSSASLVLVAFIGLPETHHTDLVSVHEFYTYFLFMFRKNGKCTFVCFINGIKRVGEGVGVGGSGRWRAHKAVFFRRRMFQVLRERHSVRIAGTMNVWIRLWIAAWFAWQGSELPVVEQ